jgi:hypothetical protein
MRGLGPDYFDSLRFIFVRSCCCVGRDLRLLPCLSSGLDALYFRSVLG